MNNLHPLEKCGVESHLPKHITPASSPCPQLFCPKTLWGQFVRVDSWPVHSTLSSHIGPVPLPKWALVGAEIAWPQPSCLHTTSALANCHSSSQMVPHWPLYKISTLPEHWLAPPTTCTCAANGSRKENISIQLQYIDWTKPIINSCLPSMRFFNNSDFTCTNGTSIMVVSAAWAPEACEWALLKSCCVVETGIAGL